MRRIRFRVKEELPPKKTRSKKGGSMWSSKTEARRLIALREKALHKMGSQPLFAGDVRLTLRVHVGFRDKGLGNKGSGDLDNFVSGVCDGLMNAQGQPNIDEDLWRENPDVHPTRSIAFKDDSQVVKINAEKLAIPEDHSWYEIELEGE